MHATARPIATASLALVSSSVIAVTQAIVPPPDVHRVVSAAVRLVDNPLDILGDLTNLGGLSLPDLGSLDLGSLDLGGLANVPYNLFADVVNIPYYESLALEEYAYALGPAGSTGGVPGWIPPGDNIGGDLYTLGGTGSWYMESIGNTWGWDDGNWPQLAAISQAILPFSFTEPIAAEVQSFAQSEFIDGAHIGCEFECANPLGYILGWLHGDTSLTSLLSGTTFPTTVADTVGPTAGISNLFYLFDTLVSPNTPDPVVWSGEPTGGLSLLAPFEAIANNLTGSPQQLMFPDLGSVFSNALKLGEDVVNDFSPFEEGSFLYWGASTDYSIPSAIGGTITDFTGIPNQFGLLNLGAEPLSGYSSNPLDLPGNFAQGLQYFLDGAGTDSNGILGYLNPEIYLQALNNDIGTLTNPNDLLAALPLVGYLGLGNDVSNEPDIAYGSLLGTFPTGFFSGPFDASTLDSFNPASLLGGAVDPSTLTTDLSGLLGGAVDPSTLTTDLSGLLGGALDPSTLTTDLSGLLGGALDPSTLTTDLSGVLPGVGTDLASSLGTNLATDLSSVLGTSAVQLVPDLALQLLSAF
jgi:hypothetical protein